MVAAAGLAAQALTVAAVSALIIASAVFAAGIATIVPAMIALISGRAGSTRAGALSNHPAWQVTHALWIADDRRLAAAPVCAQVKYNLIDRAAERELAPACVRFGLSIVPYGPLHGRLLANTQVQHRGIHSDQRFGGPGFTETELEIGRAVQRLSQDWGLQPFQVSLAWLLSRPAVASAIVGAETVEEVTANATAADVILEQAQLDALTALRAGNDS